MTANPLKTLVVEDDLVTGRVMQRLLQLHGHCDVAANGQEALQAVERAHRTGEPYRLVCLDIMMPVMDGREALRAIRQLEKAHGVQKGSACMVVMTTALDDSSSIDGAFADRCDGYLTKPIGRQKLVGELNRLGLLS